MSDKALEQVLHIVNNLYTRNPNTVFLNGFIETRYGFLEEEILEGDGADALHDDFTIINMAIFGFTGNLGINLIQRHTGQDGQPVLQDDPLDRIDALPGIAVEDRELIDELMEADARTAAALTIGRLEDTPPVVRLHWHEKLTKQQAINMLKQVFAEAMEKKDDA